MTSDIFDNIDLTPENVPMQTGKASGWLGTYHWVSLPVNDSNRDIDTVKPATEWCQEHFGASGSRWFEKKGQFYFKDEKDQSMFMLRWSS